MREGSIASARPRGGPRARRARRARRPAPGPAHLTSYAVVKVPQRSTDKKRMHLAKLNVAYKHPVLYTLSLPTHSGSCLVNRHQLLERGPERPAHRARVEGSAKDHCGQAPHPISTTVGNARLEIRTGLDGEAFWDNVDTGAAPGEALEFGRRTTPRRSERSNWDLTMYL